jgi:hypothetical protein
MTGEIMEEAHGAVQVRVDAQLVDRMVGVMEEHGETF